ncbi:AbrB/MazE/SpoVT family DNA-binding domain-containing protein [Leptolinea tardivitalis]|uniref:SpoVT-AbrB domain-containing protein n=1 Tax=Leptolinea tardivitalis TaxID=229920 RepID=A0A0P6XEW3_9CHLR|nr:AbrB/MazE/SpoVT family DNA-binding domain-containing protein [Leptolinea tardivitalis]KPL73716.1 hypothetical protein ADM99_02515 [Leptolinea tardivitalis]GAP22812.1 protein containing looped-hinge helix DNA binding domain, AbrB family [Leptolinea tardivitalis]
MTLTTVSSKYQIVIPREIRENLKIKPGQKLQMIQIGRRIEIILLEPIEAARGIFPHLNVTDYREQDDREI